MTDFRPEAQTLLMVRAGTPGRPALVRLAGGILAETGLEDVA